MFLCNYGEYAKHNILHISPDKNMVRAASGKVGYTQNQRIPRLNCNYALD